MSNQSLDAFARQADALLSRRRTIQGIGLGFLAAIIPGFEDSLAKNKKKKRRRRRRRRKDRKKRKNSSPPTCAEQCSEGFDACFERAADSTLCGETLSTLCTPCFSDQDCVESDFPYCLNVNGVIDRATGEISPFLTSFCAPIIDFVDAVCANVFI